MTNRYKILMVNLPFSGHTNPTLGLSRRLIELGHEVTYIHSPEWKEKIEKTGAVFIPYDNYPDNLPTSKKEIKSWDAAYLTALRIGKECDCLIYEMLFIQGKILSEKLGIPAFRLFSTFALNEKVLSDFGKTGGLYLTSIFRIKSICQFISRILQRKYDLKYGDIIKEISENGPALNFVYTIKEFQIYQDDFDSNYVFVGPSLDRQEETLNLNLEEIPFPIIYISLGTLLNTSTRFFRKCIEAFSGKDIFVIMSVGQTVSIDSLGKIPENIVVYPHVPQLEVLKHSNLFITHGGMNSVNEAIFYGVPMLVVPVGNDQPTVAKRVSELHIGKYIRKKELGVESLLQNAMEIVNDTSYINNISKFKIAAQHAGGNSYIAEMIINSIEIGRSGPLTPQDF